MKVNAFALLAAAVAGVLGATGVASANLVTNGDFSANASSYAVFPGYNLASNGVSTNPSAPTGWTPASNPTEQGVNGPDVSWDPNASGSKSIFGPASSTISNASGTVNDFLLLQNQPSGSFTYTYATTAISLTAGVNYTLSFDIGQRSADSTQGYLRLIVSDASGSLFDSLHSSGIENLATDYQPSTSSWTQESLNFTATATGAGSLLFANDESYYNSGFDATVDVANVTVNPTSAPVPEPASLSLVAVGAVALLRRRQ